MWFVGNNYTLTTAELGYEFTVNFTSGASNITSKYLTINATGVNGTFAVVQIPLNDGSGFFSKGNILWLVILILALVAGGVYLYVRRTNERDKKLKEALLSTGGEYEKLSV